MIGIAVLLVAPVVWRKLAWLVPNRSETVRPQSSDEGCDGLVSVVERWDALKQCCVQQGMTKAVEELQKIFPLFVEIDGGEKEDE